VEPEGVVAGVVDPEGVVAGVVDPDGVVAAVVVSSGSLQPVRMRPILRIITRDTKISFFIT
jgi:hypothetical protein